MKVQDQLKAPNESEQETTEQVKELQAALTAAQLDQQHAKAAQKDLVNRLQYANQLLEKAKHNISNKNAEISALKDHLERYIIEMDNLTQQLDDTNDQLYMVRRGLKHAYEQKQEPKREKQHSASPLQSRVPCPRTRIQRKKRRATTQTEVKFTNSEFDLESPSKLPLAHNSAKPVKNQRPLQLTPELQANQRLRRNPFLQRRTTKGNP